jgi:transposase
MAVLVPEHSAAGRSEQAGSVAVGIDPSRAALQIAALSPRGDERRERRIPLGPAAVAAVEEAIGGGDAVIAIEGSHATGQLFLLELLARRHDVREVQPVVSKRFRQALSEDHTDRKDASGLALLARWKADLPPVRFSEAQAVCKRATRLREQLVRERTRSANRLHAALSETYGAAYKGLFVDLLAKKALRFFTSYPTLNDAVDAPDEVAALLGQGAAERLQRAGRWRDGPYLEYLRTEVRALAAQVLALKDRVAELDRALAALPMPPEVGLLQTMPGIGLATALTIAGDTGDPARFRDAHRYVAYCGLAPATHQSGAGGPTPKPRHRFNRHLKRAFLLLALAQVRWCPEARAYYDRKRAEGKRHWPALRCLARQLCRVAYRMLAQGCPSRDPSPDSAAADRRAIRATGRPPDSEPPPRWPCSGSRRPPTDVHQDPGNSRRSHPRTCPRRP